MKKLSGGVGVEAAVRAIAAELAAAGIESAMTDARRLAEAATGCSREELVMRPARMLGPAEAERLSLLAGRRLAREPVSRIVGERGFYGRQFEITPDTLDPRPDTETLVQLALDIAREHGWADAPLGIIDIGTGSGCILLTLLAELRRAHGLGTDISPAALAVAERNAARLELSARARWQTAGCLAGVAGAFDLIISNPPYIPSSEIAVLEPEVQRFDPHLALDGGFDGLDIYRAIITEVATVAAPNAWCVVEVGAGQAAAVVDLVRAHCGARTADTARLRMDLGGHIRCVAWKPLI